MDSNQPQPQCQHFVVRKKRLCRMTVRPGRAYCGEHEPKPLTAAGEDDSRVPCPYDSKHTCYASKLERHLAICNARPSPAPPYIQLNVNAPPGGVISERKPLGQVPIETILRVVEKVHRLYEAYIAPTLTSFPHNPIHWAVEPEFAERGRTEASLRHLRQASSLLHLVESEGMVGEGTCYVELGAGKGQLSLFAWRAWCAPRCDVTASTGNGDVSGASQVISDADDVSSSCVLLVDRAALRHKRDAKMRAETPAQDSPGALGRWCRVRADLAHVVLRRVPVCRQRTVVGLAKHLCGAATDFALRCLTGSGPRGGVLATCCHHRCEVQHYTGITHLMELGISPEELNVMLGIVSWATCGDGRARAPLTGSNDGGDGLKNISDQSLEGLDTSYRDQGDSHGGILDSGHESISIVDLSSLKSKDQYLDREPSEMESDISNGTNILYNNNQSKQKSNSKYSKISEYQENCDDYQNHEFKEHSSQKSHILPQVNNDHSSSNIHSALHGTDSQTNDTHSLAHLADSRVHDNDSQAHVNDSQVHVNDSLAHVTNYHVNDTQISKLSQSQRSEAGRRAKALLDWGRVLYLRGHGFDARLCHFVPTSVSLENVCIVAKKQS